MRLSFQNVACSSVLALYAMVGAACAQDASDVGGRNPEKAMFLAGWMLYPSVTEATVFNTNVHRTQSDHKSEFGLDINPSFEMYRQSGIQKTAVYGALDTQLFDGRLAADNVQGSFGITHTIELQRDLTLQMSGGFNRQSGVMNKANTQQSLSPLSPLWDVLAVSSQEETQWSGSVSLEKKFGQGFISLSALTQNGQYDSAELKAQNHFGTSVAVKAGYYISPSVYAFVAPAVQMRHYQLSGLDTQTKTMIAGLGTDRSSVLKGEIYAGIADQHGSSPVGGNVRAPAFGVNVTYVPLPSLILKASLDHNYSASAPTLASAQSVSTTHAVVTGRYLLTPGWFAEAKAGYGITHYDDDKENDHFVTAGVGMGYDIQRNFDLRLNYQYAKLMSHLANASYQQDIYSAGLNYHY